MTYIPDHVADELMNNLIKFMDEHPSTEIVFEEEKSEEKKQTHANTPEISFPAEDLVDILTDESWLTLDMIGETPAPEDVFPIPMKIFLSFCLCNNSMFSLLMFARVFSIVMYSCNPTKNTLH